MPKLSGKDIISESTEKVIRRTMVISSAAILAKIYDIPLNDLKVLGMELPSSLFDTAFLLLVGYSAYSLVLHWSGDLLAFRLWYRESSAWSEFGTNMRLDKGFIRGGIPLLMRLYDLEREHKWPAIFADLDDEAKERYADFQQNVKLYCLRLEQAGTRFSMLSSFGHYYVWVQCFLLPLAACAVAAYLLVKYGTFVPPTKL